MDEINLKNRSLSDKKHKQKRMRHEELNYEHSTPLDRSYQSHFDITNSTLTIQPIIYKDVSLLSSSIRFKKSKKPHRATSLYMKKNVNEPEEPTEFFNKPRYVSNVEAIENLEQINFQPEFAFPSYYVYNNLDATSIRDLFSKPAIEIVKIDENEKVEGKDEVKSEDGKELKEKKEEIIAENENVLKKNDDPPYLRKKYYLFYSNEPNDDKNLSTSSVCSYCCLKQFYGMPCYIWTIIFLLLVTAFAILIWLFASVIYFQNLNKSYFVSCTSNNDCDVNLLLHCAVENSACMCPASLSTGRCDCSPGYYWSGTKCSLLLKYNDTKCANDYNCDPTKFLRCINETCTCGYQKEWNPNLGICDYVYVGCYNDTRTVSTLMFSSQTPRLEYFVEICIDTCKKKSSKYAMVNYYSSINSCYCSNTYNNTTSASCDIYCAGSVSTGRICGSSTVSVDDKAVYKII